MFEPSNLLEGDANYQLDAECLESQLSIASDVLKQISTQYGFSTFSHFGRLVELVNEKGGNPVQAISALENWDYSSYDFITTTGYGNCVDFAVLAQRALQSVGVPTAIIGVLPDPAEFTPKQIEFFKHRHTSLLYLNVSEGLNMFMFEPGWKFPQPIAVNPGILSGNVDWEFVTVDLTRSTFTQRTHNKVKGKYSERIFDMHPLDWRYCTMLTKRLTRIPRKMEMLNRMKEGIQTYFVRYDPKRMMFSTNTPGIVGGFLPVNLSANMGDSLEDCLEYDGLVNYLDSIYSLHVSLPPEFWVAGE